MNKKECSICEHEFDVFFRKHHWFPFIRDLLNNSIVAHAGKQLAVYARDRAQRHKESDFVINVM